MEVFFVDDSKQTSPYRKGMKSLIAVGGVYVPDSYVQDLEKGLEQLCIEYKFSQDDIFKWSPGKELWMRDNLKGEIRKEFYLQSLGLAQNLSVEAIVVIEDAKAKKATNASNNELDVINLFLERAHILLKKKDSRGIVIVAQPSGDRNDENDFLSNCINTLRCGTDYIKPDRIALNILSAPAKFHRCLQLADIVTSCSVAFIAGEKRYSPPIFQAIMPILAKDHRNIIGGTGLKIHPDVLYGNLYHWLLGDTHIWKHSTGFPLPAKDLPYFSCADEP